jgi:hypothetical protein
MALTQEQAQRLRQMSPENRSAFHLNRIATSLEAIEAAVREIVERDRRTAQPEE